MEPRRALPRPLPILLAAFAVVLLARVSAANEVGARGAAQGLVIHDAAETLEHFCSWDDQGKCWLRLPGGSRFELVTSTADPAIANPGDGAFHPFDAAEVRRAIAGLRYPLGGIRAEIFLLPFPRRGGLESAAGPELILLAPGVRALGLEQQHAETVHELGHVVQYARMPDGDLERWGAYRSLRGISDESVYAATRPHADRPHEIFAEDFRALFGDALANASGTVENGRITAPAAVSGLASFLLGLAGAPPASGALRVTVDPDGGVSFAQSGADAAPLDLFDVVGRRVATVASAMGAAGAEWRWDGRVAGARRAGVLFARVRGGSGRARVTLLR